MFILLGLYLGLMYVYGFYFYHMNRPDVISWIMWASSPLTIPFFIAAHVWMSFS